MATRIYGASDDNIEFDGDVHGEVGHNGWPGHDDAALIVCSDGTIMTIKYGKADQGIWVLNLISRGSCFERIEECEDEDADIYSDVAHFRDGLKWAYVATEWGRVK